MLKKLCIKNFLLIQHIEMEFSKGLNILTGESGSGKSAILKAIDLLLGGKVDSSSIHPGADVAIIEAIFFCSVSDVAFKPFLNTSVKKEITIRREISNNGRSRLFLNDQLIPIGQMKDHANFFAEYVSQKQASALSRGKFARSIIDTFAGIREKTNKLSDLWKKKVHLTKKLEAIIDDYHRLQANLAHFKEEMQWIEKVNYKQGEEKQLEKELSLSLCAQDRLELSEMIYAELIDSTNSIFSRLKALEKLFSKLFQLDKSLHEPFKLFQSAMIEVEEVGYTLRGLKSTIDLDPQRLQNIENRIKELDHLKKKYGQSFSQIQSQKKIMEQSLSDFEKIHEEMLITQERLKELETKCDHICQEITSAREKTKTQFEKNIAQELQSLNLSQSSFAIQLRKNKQSATGCESVQFLFSANRGVEMQSLEKTASGGELSRVMLAIKCLIADKDHAQCLIFDEIDANVGGKSASIIGEKLLALSKYRQVICVTHFVQVAKKAQTHFLVEKKHQSDINSCTVQKLSFEAKKLEFQRMIGHDPLWIKGSQTIQ